jgi:hypothetical protein
VIKPLTNAEIERIEKRIDEIQETLRQCDEHRDADVIANLQTELQGIDATLAEAAVAAEQAERREASGLIRFRRLS